MKTPESKTEAPATGTVPTPPQQIEIEDLSAEQIQQAITQTHAQTGLLALTERTLARQLTSVQAELEQCEVRNAALYKQAEKLGITDVPGVRFG